MEKLKMYVNRFSIAAGYIVNTNKWEGEIYFSTRYLHFSVQSSKEGSKVAKPVFSELVKGWDWK